MTKALATDRLAFRAKRVLRRRGGCVCETGSRSRLAGVSGHSHGRGHGNSAEVGLARGPQVVRCGVFVVARARSGGHEDRFGPAVDYEAEQRLGDMIGGVLRRRVGCEDRGAAEQVFVEVGFGQVRVDDADGDAIC
jgi:hypothetical protein